jgi:uncharacterized protein (TIGR02145 family)
MGAFSLLSEHRHPNVRPPSQQIFVCLKKTQCLVFSHWQVLGGHLPIFSSFLEQISLDSQNLKKFDKVKLGTPLQKMEVWLCLTLKITKMKVRFLPFLMLPILGMAQANSNGEVPLGGNTSSERQTLETKRNASFNLEEIKVRWKKAALENCPGVPCVSITPPGPVTNIVATVTSPTSASVAFGTPASDGGSPITGYEVTATPTTPSAPAKRKSSATIIEKGDKSPIIVEGLTTNVSYTFSVVALNAVGVSPPKVTVTPVTPCTLNTYIATPQLPALILNSPIDIPISIAATTGATGIGTPTGLPTGVTATWINGYIAIFGIPTAANTFNYTIPLTGGCGSVNATGTITVIEPPSFTCGSSTISDVEGNSYETVLIGFQCWTKQNLKVKKYNDGSKIPEITSAGTWNTTIVTGARTVYNDLPANLSTYGYLYNWYAATDVKKICPTGWHVPTDGEWTTLIQLIVPTETLGTSTESTTAGTLMKKNDAFLWTTNTGTNISGFSALPGGSRDVDGSFYEISYNAFFWSATETGYSNAWRRSLYFNNGSVGRNSGSKTFGASVRCLRDSD